MMVFPRTWPSTEEVEIPMMIPNLLINLFVQEEVEDLERARNLVRADQEEDMVKIVKEVHCNNLITLEKLI